MRAHREYPDALNKYGRFKIQKIMEEKKMMDLGFVEIDSSDLYVRGGASSTFEKVFSKIKSMINFIADYVPQFLKGLKDGFSIF